MRSLHRAALWAFGALACLLGFIAILAEARHLPEIVSGEHLASMRNTAALAAAATLVAACVALCLAMVALKRHAEGHR